ncbi:MAG: AAA family ATPase [Patescibacteria group bacterium]
MTLKSIELSGFKSFGKKSLMSFTTPITCIVGPNGSGKSNVVESIRFVLGEQSMKSLRGKGGVDLIFKGSKTLSSSSRASATITFDNKSKIFSFTNSGLGISLDYDEISISREVFPDGANVYSINGTEVRLKDVVDLLASVNIGSSGHHIISQGEADRVLNASNKDRRAMIEDALGLKVYQFRIKESERKLEKTTANMKEVQTLRREIAPHLAFLKKQVEKVEKSRAMREELGGLYRTYLSSEFTYIQKEKDRLAHLRRTLDEKGVLLDERIEGLRATQEKDNHESENALTIKEHDEELSRIRTEKDERARRLGRIEGVIESLERELSRESAKEEKAIPAPVWKEAMRDLEEKIDEALSSEDMPEIVRILRSMKERIVNIGSSVHHVPEADPRRTIELNEMKTVKDGIVEELRQISESEQKILREQAHLRDNEKEAQSALRAGERMLYELLREKNEVASDMHSLSFEEEKLTIIKNAFEMELTEAAVLIGTVATSYARETAEGDISRQFQDDLRRKIERIKIKLEDAGSGNGAEIMKEYQETEERDVFLSKELNDLAESIESLRLLIQELKETLDSEFKEGVEKINKQFQEFFALMFGGGSAFLSIVMEHKRLKKGSDEDIEEEAPEETELGFERGIEINVTLPQKKVKDLHMLSGGERSLTSIALLFAISQVNPPPFLVLDETDAALDEANSRKYGNMLENLSKYSQLVVVTHNRETMSRAQVLYGVTMSSEGASKLLSIRLEDASVYAK